MDLFASAAEERLRSGGPLAARLRPERLEDIVGQSHLLGNGKPLTSLIQSRLPTSLILWGPPGSGKTTIARVLAKSLDAEWVALSAVSATVAEVRNVIAAARDRLGASDRKTLLFLDEIHRFNRAQQDSLLHAVEEGLLALVGATTENPYFEVNGPLLSRSVLFRLEPLDRAGLRSLLRRALESPHGLPGMTLEDDAVELLVEISGGDGRRLLNLLEWGSFIAAGEERAEITVADIEAAGQSRLIHHDRTGDNHYDVISAFIKSMRGSDSSAALHYLARMLEAGEDANFIARRMVIFASEDVGNADPGALQVAVAAAQAVDLVGLPEARINLAHAVTYLSEAPKSNASYLAMERALKDVRDGRGGEVPLHLRSTGYRGARDLGHGGGYQYPHDYSNGYVEQVYMPEDLQFETYYEPKEIGFENEICRRMRVRRGRDNGIAISGPTDSESSSRSENQSDY